MKTRMLKIVVLVGAIAALLACTPTRTTKSAGEQIDDSAVTAKVTSALASDPRTSAFQIDVETFRGAVQLNGFVDSEDMKPAATRVANTVEGVKSVQNNLSVGPSHRTAGEYVDDSVMTARVKAALVGDPVVAGGDVNVEVRNGVVQLAGFVGTSEQKRVATEVAGRVAGVTQVDNQLQVKQR